MSRPVRSTDRRWSQHEVFEAEEFAERPSLKRAAARRVRRVGIHNLRDVAQPGLAEMLVERREEAMAGLVERGLGATADAEPCFHEWPDEPRPHSSLVITAVPLPDISVVACAIAGLPGRQTAQALRSQESALDGFHHRPRSVVLEQAKRQPADGEDLIGPQAGIRSALLVVAVDHIEQARS